MAWDSIISYTRYGSMASENKYNGNNCYPFFLLVKISERFLVI